ncbi:MAG: carboxypeptidase-like regulatory domain-containing protein [Dysgonamonadaceae bacterium]|jgi:hypothetical protein|nr:carboxypeptidase-like regulatory domain-containing protein [Dysgonamonadaceae bacterium]
MKNLNLKVRKWFRGLLMSSSLTAVAFIFHACYGAPADFGFDVKLTGTVKSKTTRQPVKGIKVSTPNNMNYGLTDEKGDFSFYAYIDSQENRPDSVVVKFIDLDGVENGYFQDKEIIIRPMGQDEVKINVELDEKVDE